LYGVVGGKPYLYFNNPNGGIKVEKGTSFFVNDAFDALYTDQDKMFTGHTWKDYYLYCEKVNDIQKIRFREYGAIEISQKQFLEFEGAQNVIDQIKATDKKAEIRNILYRGNNIININYIIRVDGGFSQNYVTVHYDDSKVCNMTFGEGGKYEAAIIPKIATYPVFKNPK
jgi:hypothetical protein